MLHTGFVILLLLVAATALGNATLAISYKGLIVCGSSLGCLKGVYMPGYQIKRFEAYLGIPYALPPVGELRFSVSEVKVERIAIGNATDCNHFCPLRIPK